jgi:outer membrane biogenesis lipoprotein LolB
VKLAFPLIAMLATLLLPACATDPKEAAAREWQKSECNRVLDKEDRDRCIRRAEGRPY